MPSYLPFFVAGQLNRFRQRPSRRGAASGCRGKHWSDRFWVTATFEVGRGVTSRQPHRPGKMAPEAEGCLQMGAALHDRHGLVDAKRTGSALRVGTTTSVRSARMTIHWSTPTSTAPLTSTNSPSVAGPPRRRRFGADAIAYDAQPAIASTTPARRKDLEPRELLNGFDRRTSNAIG